MIGLISRNPNKSNSIVIYTLIAIAAAILVFFWVDYQGAKRKLDETREALDAERVLTAAQQDAIDRFIDAQAEYAALVQEFDRFRADVREEIGELREGLSAEEIRNAAAADHIQATSDISGRVNRAFGLFDDTTSSANRAAEPD